MIKVDSSSWFLGLGELKQGPEPDVDCELWGHGKHCETLLLKLWLD